MRAVQDPVIAGERQRQCVTRDDNSLPHHRHIPDGAGRERRGLRRDHERGRLRHAIGAGVPQRERRA